MSPNKNGHKSHNPPLKNEHSESTNIKNGQTTNTK